MPTDLKDDETRLSRYGGLSAARKAEIRAQQKADLDEAEKARKRPLGSRVLDVYYQVNPLVPAKRRDEERKLAAEDEAARESRYQTAKQRAEMSDDVLNTEKRYYSGDVRKINKDDTLFKKGGAVSASRRGDGIAKRGKTRGRMV
jgi:hypothetical protein